MEGKIQSPLCPVCWEGLWRFLCLFFLLFKMEATPNLAKELLDVFLSLLKSPVFWVRHHHLQQLTGQECHAAVTSCDLCWGLAADTAPGAARAELCQPQPWEVTWFQHWHVHQELGAAQSCSQPTHEQQCLGPKCSRTRVLGRARGPGQTLQWQI